jgi:predicted membrane protein
MANILRQHLEDIKKYDVQRKGWLVLSAFVVTIILFLIFDHSEIVKHGFLFPFVVAGITLSVVWWYWSMRLIKQLLQHRKEETEVLMDLCDAIKEVKQEVRNFLPK